MAKKKKLIEINRNKYQEIRKMDHNSMEVCIGEYYEKGFKAGQMAAGSSFDAKLALEAISNIKGIGPAKMEQIKLAMMAAGAKMPEE